MELKLVVAKDGYRLSARLEQSTPYEVVWFSGHQHCTLVCVFNTIMRRAAVSRCPTSHVLGKGM